MNRVLRVLLILVCFEMGVLLMILPWSNFWELNYFLTRYPVLTPYLMNSAVRGAVSGLGLLDVLLAAGMIRRREPGTLVSRS